jgi:hypothetical protein
MVLINRLYIACQVPRQDLVIVQAPNLPSSTSTSPSRALTPMLGACKRITRHCMRPHIHIAAFWRPARSPAPPLSRYVLRSFRCRRRPRNPGASNPSFPPNHSTQVYMRTPPDTHKPPSRAAHPNCGGHGQRIAFPHLVHSRRRACARGYRESTLCVLRRVCMK